MQMSFSKMQANVPVTVFKIDGDLDGTTYEDAIAGARSLYDQGARHMLLDLSGVPYISSAGVVAVHTIAAMLQGEEAPDADMGWEALHAVERDEMGGKHANLKLLNPQPRVEQVLETVGLKNYLEIHNDLQSALASF